MKNVEEENSLVLLLLLTLMTMGLLTVGTTNGANPYKLGNVRGVVVRKKGRKRASRKRRKI